MHALCAQYNRSRTKVLQTCQTDLCGVLCYLLPLVDIL